MKKFTKFIWLGMALALLAAIVMPLAAQDTAADPGAGNGGVVIQTNIGDDPSTYNPLLGSDSSSSAVYGLMYPTLIAVNSLTLVSEPNLPFGMATGWEYDETGTLVTITLRQDMFWSDGTPITANDYLWSANAVRSGLTSSPRTNAFYQLDNGTVVGGPIHEITVVDDYTLQIRLGNVVTDEAGEVVLDENGKPQLTPNCDAINDVSFAGIVPAHIFEAAFGTDYAAMDADPYFFPRSESGEPATFGPFTDPFVEFGVQVSLLADQDFPDTQLGYVAPSEWIFQNVENTTVQYERFLAGDFTYISVSPNNQNDFRTHEGFQTLEYPENGYTYLAFNLADPNNPQPGVDADGNYIDQGMHPIFGDVNVRIALAHALDVLAMIGTRPEGDSPATGILEGNGYPSTTHNADFTPIDPGLSPREYNPELAMQMLEEAGWTDSDGNGVRECHGCLYATTVDAAYEGTDMAFELITNSSNLVRAAAGETIRLQLAEVGVQVNYQAIEFSTLITEFRAQQFDAVVLGWTGLYIPFTPGSEILNIFGSGGDTPGGGFNGMSYQNQEMEALLRQADSLPAAEDGSYPACDRAARDEMYNEALRMLYNNPPYVWLFSNNIMLAAQGTVENWDPVPFSPRENIDAWVVTIEN